MNKSKKYTFTKIADRKFETDVMPPDDDDGAKKMNCCVRVGKRIWKWRTLIAFWFLGLCNNFGYVVMLTAAHDILKNIVFNETSNETFQGERICNIQSTGVVLLFDIVPSIFIKLIAPFFPFLIHFRILAAILLQALGFILVGIHSNIWLVYTGIGCISLSSGLGETSLLSYMPYFKTANVISAWSSGTGGAGVLGALMYTALIQIGLTPSATMFTMLSVPIFMGICFWLLIEHPDTKGRKLSQEDNRPHLADAQPLKSRLRLLPKIIIKYMLPFGLIYVFEYFINQGLTELILFPGEVIDESAQYRWYGVDYQIGVIISRSSMNLVRIQWLWCLVILQSINVVLILTQTFVDYLRSFWVVLIIIFWEGLIGGAGYVNTYRKINEEMPPLERQFTMSMNSFGDAIGITLAGLIAMPTHNAICKLPSQFK